MRQEIRTKLKERRGIEMSSNLENEIKKLEDAGYEVFFGEIGNKTTYAFIKKGEEEVVGYTYVKDLIYKDELVGKYKALQQVIARKSIIDNKASSKE